MYTVSIGWVLFHSSRSICQCIHAFLIVDKKTFFTSPFKGFCIDSSMWEHVNTLLFYLSTFLFSQTNSIVMAFAPNSFLLLVAMPFVFGSSRLTLFERFSIVLCGSCHHSGLGHPRLVFLLVRDENTHSVFVTLKKEQCVVLCLSSRSAGQPTIVLIPAVLTDRKEGRKEGRTQKWIEAVLQWWCCSFFIALFFSFCHRFHLETDPGWMMTCLRLCSFQK